LGVFKFVLTNQDNKIGEEGLIKIARSLNLNLNLKYLSIPRCGLGTRSADEFIKMLIVNPSITVLGFGVGGIPFGD
jgi:hypothetical protein